MKEEINDYLVSIGFNKTIHPFHSDRLKISSYFKEDCIYKLDYYKHNKILCSNVLNYFVFIPSQGFITIIEETDSSYEYNINQLSFNFSNLEQFKTVLSTIIK